MLSNPGKSFLNKKALQRKLFSPFNWLIYRAKYTILPKRMNKPMVLEIFLVARWRLLIFRKYNYTCNHRRETNRLPQKVKGIIKNSSKTFFSDILKRKKLSNETPSFKICQKMCISDAFQSLWESLTSSRNTRFLIWMSYRGKKERHFKSSDVG